jgi:hypothetical protein
VELHGQHETGESVCALVLRACEEVRTIQKAMNWRVRSLNFLTANACVDTTAVNTGEKKGWLALLELHREKGVEEGEVYCPMKKKGCTDHIVALIAKAWHRKLAEEFSFVGPNKWFLSLLHYLAQSIQELLRGRLGSLFDGVCICLGLPHVARYRISASRYVTIDLMCADIITYYPIFFLFFGRMQEYKRKVKNVFNLLQSPAVLAAAAVAGVAARLVYKPLMEIAAKVKSADLYSVLLKHVALTAEKTITTGETIAGFI